MASFELDKILQFYVDLYESKMNARYNTAKPMSWVDLQQLHQESMESCCIGLRNSLTDNNRNNYLSEFYKEIEIILKKYVQMNAEVERKQNVAKKLKDKCDAYKRFRNKNPAIQLESVQNEDHVNGPQKVMDSLQTFAKVARTAHGVYLFLNSMELGDSHPSTELCESWMSNTFEFDPNDFT